MGETESETFTETHVNHQGMKGVKERNRIKEGEKEGKLSEEERGG